MEKTEEFHSKLAVKYINTAIREPCPICGALRKDAKVPLWIFPSEGYEAVCAECAKKHAPELVELLEYFYSSGGEKRFWERVKKHKA